MAVSAIPGIRREEEGKISEFTGSIMLAIPSVGVGLLLPSDWSWYILYLVYPFGHFIILAVILVYIQNKKAKEKLSN